MRDPSSMTLDQAISSGKYLVLIACMRDLDRALQVAEPAVPLRSHLRTGFPLSRLKSQFGRLLMSIPEHRIQLILVGFTILE